MQSALVSLTDELCRSYLDLRWHFDPAAASQVGLTEHDGRLGHFDGASVDEHLAAFRALEAAVEELDIGDAADEIDRTALLDDVRGTIFRLQYESPHRHDPTFWALHLCESLATVGRHLESQQSGPELALSRLRGVPSFVEDARATIQLRDAAPPLIEAGIRLVDAAQTLVADLRDRLGGYAEENPDAAAELALDALTSWRTALTVSLSGDEDGQVANGIVGVGTEQFDRLLHHLHAVRAGSAELWRYLLHLEEETEEELASLAATDDPGRSWLDQIRDDEDPSQPPSTLIAEAEAELYELATFLRDRDVFPSVDLPTVGVLPRYLEVIQGLPEYRPAARGSVGLGAEASIGLGPWASTTRWLSPWMVELGIPGLHQHETVAAGLGAEVRRHLESRLTRGGWGLYAVRLMDELGFWPTTRGRLVARSYLLLRILLAQIDVGIHKHQITVEGGVARLEDRFDLDPSHAHALVIGCLLQPTEAVGAIVGQRELFRLRDDFRHQEGAGYSLAEFHARVLSFGGLPVPLVRWGMDFDD